MPAKSHFKRVLEYLCGLVFAFGLMITPFFVAHQIYWRPIEKEALSKNIQFQEIPGVSAESMRHLGRLSPPRAGSFSNFPKEKRPGVVRVGCFGDSFTYGEEVSQGNDYPSYLQKMFTKNGYSNVEVLNFGSSGFGGHQTHMMWELVGRAYDLDYVLIGPASYQVDRDSTFNLFRPFFVHSRYVLDSSGLRLVEVPGESYLDKIAHYHRLIPDLNVWRYDRGTLPIFAGIIGGERSLKNPLYYTRESPFDEIFATYRELFLRMREHSKTNFILMHWDRSLVDLASDLKADNLIAFQMILDKRFPNRAPGNHFSAFGNHYTASLFYQILTGGAIKLNRVTPLSSREEPVILEKRVMELSPSKYFVAFGEKTVASFPGDRPQPAWMALGQGNILDSNFTPLKTIHPDGTEIFLYSNKRRTRFGRLRYVDARLPIGRIEISPSFTWDRETGRNDGFYTATFEIEKFSEGNPIFLAVGKQIVGNVRPVAERGFALSGSILPDALQVDLSLEIDKLAIKDRTPVFITYTTNEKDTQRVPLFYLKQVERKESPLLRKAVERIRKRLKRLPAGRMRALGD